MYRYPKQWLEVIGDVRCGANGKCSVGKGKGENTIATDRAQLAHRYDTVVAKWSPSLWET